MYELIRWFHLLAASLWLGGLAMLALTAVVGLRSLERGAFKDLMVRLGRSFLYASIVIWTTLAITGWLMAAHHLASLGALWSTAWGRTLTEKIGLAVLILATAAVHVITGRGQSRGLLVISRAMAVLIAVETLGVFYLAARLAETA